MCVIFSNLINRAAILSICNFFHLVLHHMLTRWAKIIFLRCQTPEATNIYFPPIEWPHIQNCHHSPLLDACWLLCCSSLTGLASGKMVEPDIVSTATTNTQHQIRDEFEAQTARNTTIDASTPSSTLLHERRSRHLVWIDASYWKDPAPHPFDHF